MAIAGRLAARAELEKLLSVQITIPTDKDQAINEADVVICSTSANLPIVDANMLKRGALVTSVSSDIHPAHEVSPDQLNLFDVYCDYRPSALKAWEMKQAVAQGTWSMDAILADLTDLTTTTMEISPTSLKYFRNHGVGIEDLVIAGLIINKDRQQLTPHDCAKMNGTISG